MKKYSLSFILFTFTLLLSGCDDDDYKAVNSLNDVSWHLGIEAGNCDPIIIEQEKHLSLIDVSQGAISHRWEVSEKGTYFLKGQLPWGKVDYEPLIDYSAPYVTSEGTINILFREPGEHTIRLVNTFKKPVSYTYSKWNQDTGVYDRFTKYAKHENGVYVMDTTFVIHVYDPKIVPGVKVFRDPECTDEVEIGLDEATGKNKSITLEYGKSLYYKDMSFKEETPWDKPNKWLWTCPQASIKEEGEVAALSFKALTSVEPLNVTQTVSRVPSNENKFIPAAEEQTQVVPLDVYVIPSSEPLTYTVKELDDTHLKLELTNGTFKKDLSFDASKFSLDYKNNFNGESMVEGNISIVNVAVDPKVPEVLNLTLGSRIYNTDKLFLSCSELSDVTVDGRNLTIEKPEVANVATNLSILINQTFEEGADLKGWDVIARNNYVGPFCAYNVTAANPNPSDINTSARSLYLNAGTNEFVDVVRSNIFTGKKSTYTFKFKYYIAENSTTGAMLPYFITLGAPATQDKVWYTDKSFPKWGPGKFAGKESNKWLEYRMVFDSASDMYNLQMAMDLDAFSGEIFFDDFYLANEEIRPRN